MQLRKNVQFLTSVWWVIHQHNAISVFQIWSFQEDLSTNENVSPEHPNLSQQDFNRLPSVKLQVTRAASFDQTQMNIAPPPTSPSAVSLPSNIETIGQLSVPTEVDLSLNEARPVLFPPRRQTLALWRYHYQHWKNWTPKIFNGCLLPILYPAVPKSDDLSHLFVFSFPMKLSTNMIRPSLFPRSAVPQKRLLAEIQFLEATEFMPLRRC